MASRSRKPSSSGGVTPREFEVLALICERLSNAEIAERLFVSERTVESHVGSLLRKLDAPNRRRLIEVHSASVGPRPDSASTGPPNGSHPRPLPSGTPRRTWPMAKSDPPSGHEPLPFLGREGEMDALRIWWRGTAPTPRMALVLGESGVGKTRLATAFGREVERECSPVLYGRAVEAGGSSFEPVLGALRQLVLMADDEVIDAFGETAVGALSRLVPEMAERRPELAAKASEWGEVDRSWLLGAVADCLATTGRPPMLFVLDDLQWADRPAFLLLSRLLEPNNGVRILGTCRQSLAGPTHLADFLADLRRDDQSVHRILLGGLTPTDVAGIMTSLTGAELSAAGCAFASHLHQRTDGHPFFVREVLRQLDDTGAISVADGVWCSDRLLEDLGIPEGVKDVVGQRLSHLAPPTRDVLRIAAVVGQEFDLDVVAAVLDKDQEQALSAVEEGLIAGLVQQDPVRVDRFGFIHALVHEVVLAGLGLSRRARLEWRTGEVLEELRKDELDELDGELARHYNESLPVGDGRKAFEWSRRAGASAAERFAYEEALRYYEMALVALGCADGSSDAERADVLVAVGRAAIRAGDPALWQTSCLEAASIARSAGDSERLAQAAINLLGPLGPGPQTGVVTLMEEAAEALRRSPESPRGLALLAELLARLSGYLSNLQPKRTAALADEALEVARRAGDKRSLALALMHSTQAYDLERAELEARLREAAHLAEATGDFEVVLAANSNLMSSALTWGDRGEYDERLAEYARIAEMTRAPTTAVLSATDHAGAAALDGRYRDAFQQFSAALARAELLDDSFLRMNILAGMSPVTRELGYLTERLNGARKAAASEKSLPSSVTSVVLVSALCDVGQFDEAAERLKALLAEPGDLLSGLLRRHNLVMLAHAAELLDDGRAAAQVYAWLVDDLRKGECVIVGPCAYWGALRRYLGLLALVLGRVQEAVDHHEAALGLHQRMRAAGWAARSRYDLGRALLARRQPGDRDRAVRLLDEAGLGARELGMPKLLDELLALDT